jgi:DNA polymerase I-like protein with 3'-5' exonuclease and polymerase domains/uracil-DNA glycosylase
MLDQVYKLVPTIPEHVLRSAAAMFGTSDLDYAAKLVCNDGAVLPQSGLAQQVWHMPVCWMGGEIGDDGYMSDLDLARRSYGWKENIPYMFVLPSPDEADVSAMRAMSLYSGGGRFLRDELKEAGIPLTNVMVNHAVRFKLPAGVKTYKADHRKACASLLQVDIEKCKPKVIIAFGADALRAITNDWKLKLDHVRGNVLSLQLSDGTKIPVIPTVSHLMFMTTYANVSVFRSELRRAQEIVQGVYRPVKQQTDYRVCETVAQVQKLCDDIRASGSDMIAFDTEFGNDVARNEFRYTLSVQLAWGAGKAAFVKLRTHVPQAEYDIEEEYGKPLKDGTRKKRIVHVKPEPLYGVRVNTEADEKEIWRLLYELMLDKRFQIAGHHLRVDVEQFNREGFSIDERIEDGFDTMLVHHLLCGDERQGLDHLVRKYVPTFGAYWRDLEQWLQTHSGSARLDYGYRDIPLEILIPYGLADADATWQIARKLQVELAMQPGLQALYTNVSAPTSLHLLDVERNGILVDDAERMELREEYKPVYEDLLAKLKKEINWPDFSPTSRPQMQYLLFSDWEYKDRDKIKPAIPADVKLLHLKPLYNTDKFPKQWDDLVDSGLASLNTPCSKAVVLELLSAQHPDNATLRLLKHLSVVGKFLSTYLSPVELNKHGVPVDGKGFHNNIRCDGRVTTRLSQLTETGRYTSSSANLQTQPKKQEAAVVEALVYHKFGISMSEYKKRTEDGDPDKGKAAYAGPDRIEKPDRIVARKFKRCLLPAEDHVLIEVDFKNAEVFSAAYQSGDPALIKLVDSGRDMHCEVAARSFNLPSLSQLDPALCKLELGDRADYDAWADHIKKHFEADRTVAKSVAFGTLYGRGAASLAREISKVTGKEVSSETCQKIIDTFAATYPVLWAWLAANMDSAVQNEYVETMFGRRRYFSGVSKLSQREQAAARREASNSPIQGCIDLYAQVSTLQGMYTFQDLLTDKPIDTVTDGVTRRGIAIHSGTKPTVRVQLANGASITCTPDHKLLTSTASGDEWVEAGKLTPDDVVVWHLPPKVNEYISITSGVTYTGSNAKHSKTISTQLDPLFAYVLGFLTGDGCNTSKINNTVRFVAAEADMECLEPISVLADRLGVHVSKSVLAPSETRGLARTNLHSHCITHGAFRALMDSLGVSRKKHDVTGIPSAIWNSPDDVKFAYLDGYFSADGTVSPKDGRITWVTASERLAIDIGNLIAGLGGTCAWFVDGKGYYRGGMPIETVDMFKEAGCFKYHKRKRRWLDERRTNSNRRNSTALPVWLSKQCLPAAPPKPTKSSANVLWRRVNSGDAGITMSTCRLYQHLGFKVPVGVVPVRKVEPAGLREVADISIMTNKESERRFQVGGFVVHNCVADLLAQAGILFYRFKKSELGKALRYKILLPIHDAFLIECHKDDVVMVKKLIKACMSDWNLLPGTQYKLGVDIEVYKRWGDKPIKM